MVRHLQSKLHMRTPATAEQLNGLLGEVDPIVVEQILTTGATFDEVAEALASLEDDSEPSQAPPSPKVVEVRDLLAQYVLDEPDDPEAYV